METARLKFQEMRSSRMKKVFLLTTIVSVFAAVSCLNSFAEDLSSQVLGLEQKAQRIQTQINQAKQQHSTATDQQVNMLKNSVDGLINQRVQLDAQIARIEGQMDQIKSSAQSNLDRQIAQYDKELSSVTQELVSLMAKQAAASAQPAQGNPVAQTAATPAAK